MVVIPISEMLLMAGEIREDSCGVRGSGSTIWECAWLSLSIPLPKSLAWALKILMIELARRSKASGDLFLHTTTPTVMSASKEIVFLFLDGLNFGLGDGEAGSTTMGDTFTSSTTWV
ncbi:hypothetical protein ACFE04_020063 [Oxalis oulophora]